MPTYRIVVQKSVSPDAATRSVRSTDFAGVECIDMKAPNLTEALLKLNIRYAGQSQPPRVISGEELLEIDTNAITDDALTHALTNSESSVALDDYEGVRIYDHSDFSVLVHDVAEALRSSGVVPGLSVSILRDADGAYDYTMVEIHDTATGTYRGVGREPKRLIDDRSLTGRSGVLSIARTLIETAATEHLL
jgi:hypothetical protein